MIPDRLHLQPFPGSFLFFDELYDVTENGRQVFIMGHSEYGVTANIYTHVDNGTKVKAAKLQDDYLKQLKAVKNVKNNNQKQPVLNETCVSGDTSGDT